jgi:hypothetical protein
MKGSDRCERSFDTAESETLGMWGNSMRGNREALQTPPHGIAVRDGRRRRKAVRSTCTSGRESDGLIVPREAGEQSRRVCVGRGVRRGKEGDQGGRTTSALVPDTEPGKRVTEVVVRTASCKERLAVT